MGSISGDDGEGESTSASSRLHYSIDKHHKSTSASSCLNHSIDKDDNKKSIKIKKNKNKRVSWDRIHIREYPLVFGDHPLCQDGLPVRLGWQYDDMNALAVEQIKEGMKPTLNGNNRKGETKLSERRQSYVFPRRLSYEERRDRLISVGFSLDQIKNDEIDLVVRTLKESWDDQNTTEEGICNDIVMEPVHCDYDPFADDNMMEIDVPEIDVDFNENNEDLGDITDFEF